MLTLLHIGICTGIFYLAFHVFFKNEKNHLANRIFILSAIIAGILIPIINIPFFPQVIPILNISNEVSKPILITNDNPFDWMTIVWTVFVVGIIIRTIVFTSGILKLRRLINQGVKTRMNDHVRTIIHQDFPLSSFLNYIFITQSKANNLSSFELQHELAHIHQKHSWDIIFIEITKLLFWYNPFIYLFQQRLIETHEYLADETAISQFGKGPYQAFLVQQVSLQSTTNLVHHFFSNIKKRLVMINNQTNKKLYKYFMALPLLALALGLFSFSSYPVYKVEGTQTTIVNDSIPEIDTILTFDPITGLETVVVIKDGQTSEEINVIKRSKREGIDTVVVFDPATGKESIHYIDFDIKQLSNEQTAIDTIIVFDPATGKEDVHIVRRALENNLPDLKSLERNPGDQGLDTITIFDPKTYKECIIVVDPNSTPIKVDTIYKEKGFISND